MNAFSKIAEQRILAGIERGEFDNLTGRGKPLLLDDDSWVPEDLRMAFRVLRNAGCIPRELELRKELVSLRDLIETIDDDAERLKAVRRFNHAMLTLNELRGKCFSSAVFPGYEDRICERIIKS